MEDNNCIIDNDANPYLNVGIICNLKKEIKDGPVDLQAEYDNIETVKGIENALKKRGFNTTFLEFDRDIPTKLSKAKIDIAFNIAEGIQGRGREAEIPALLNIYNIPFTGSDEVTLSIALDKALTKRLLSTYNIRTPQYIVINNIEDLEKEKNNIRYPAIVKPDAEGSSKGISDISVADSFDKLEKLVDEELKTYSQSMLIEEYISGREFTVGILGNKDEMKVFAPMEIIYKKPTQENYCVYSYNVKSNYKKMIEYKCPAEIDKNVEKEMMQMSKDIYNALECKDFARIDFRVSQDNKIYFIEANPLPGLAPGYSDFPMLAQFNDMSYDDVINNILSSALKRYGMKKEKCD